MKSVSNTAKALSFALQQILAPLPAPGNVFFLRAEPLEGSAQEWQRGIVNVQSFKPIHDRLHRDGCSVRPVLEQEPLVQPGDGFDVGLLLVTKHKQENLANLARAWAALRPGGRLICVGANDIGISSVEKAFKGIFDHPASLSKHHCKVLWGQRGSTAPQILSQWAEAGQLQMVPSIHGWSQPGLYNWNKVDAGSALLVQALPGPLYGRAADLGAGWGYLSQQLLQLCPGITSIDLFEAEHLALNAAKANLSPSSSAALGFYWHDVTLGLSPAAYDVVIMNPPFHEGKAVDVELGRAFICSAAQALIPGGQLFMVANRQLPYEEILNSAFRGCTRLHENSVYKVLTAVR